MAISNTRTARDGAISSDTPQSRLAYLVTKRCLDITVAVIALLLLAPLLLLIACMILVEDRGPILYRREVLGLNGVSFRMLKFRTMVIDAERLLADDPELSDAYRQHHYKLPRDPRVTRVGRLLRRLSLDELPQFWHILIGQMSLVGPRCIHTSEAPLFGDFLNLRQRVLPGLTGLWQVSGRSNTTYEERVQLDQEYVATCSLRLDIAIILRTFGVVLRGDGAY